MEKHRCISCNKGINLKTSFLFYSMRKKEEKADYSCDDCWSKNKDQYLNEYSRIVRVNYEDEENSEEWVKFIKVVCRKCGTSFLCESEESKKHEWENSRCVNYDYKSNKIINNINESNSPEVKPKNGERISGSIIALISFVGISILGVIGYFIWKRSKN